MRRVKTYNEQPHPRPATHPLDLAEASREGCDGVIDVGAQIGLHRHDDVFRR